MIRLVLVDDQELVRGGLGAPLERTDDIEVVGDTGSGADEVALVRAVRPDVVLMDIHTCPAPTGSPPPPRSSRTRRLAGTPIVVLTTVDTDQNILGAIRAGAAGILLKDTAPDALRQAVRVVTAGEALLSPAVTRRVVAAAASVRPSSKRLEILAEREREILVEVGAARSTTEIAAGSTSAPPPHAPPVGRLLSNSARDRARLVPIATTGAARPGG